MVSGKICFGISILSSFLLLLGSILNSVQADNWYNETHLTCDSENNRAMMRFYAGYKNEPVRSKLPDNLISEYDYLNDLPAQESCELGDGRKIILKSEMEQAFPYGQCGGHAGAYFTLKIDNKHVFYKKDWHDGRCSYGVNPVVLILDNNSLTSCKGPDSALEEKIEGYQIKSEDCRDVSERLSGDLKGGEKRRFLKDEQIRAYELINKNEEVCKYFEEPKKDEIKFGKIMRHKLGTLSTASLDINNDYKDEIVYLLSSTNNYMDGSYLIYFNDENWKNKGEDRKEFLRCFISDDCPQRSEKTFTNVDQFVEEIEDIWGEATILSAASIPETITKNYDVRYTWLSTWSFDNKTYVRFKPSNQEKHPSQIIAKLNREGEQEIICTYRGIE